MNENSNQNSKNLDLLNLKSGNLTAMQLNEAKKTRHKNKQVSFIIINF